MKQLNRLWAACAISIVCAGCAVKPVPITSSEHREQVVAGLEALFATQDPVSAPITLSDAIARGIKYNLDHRVSLMEQRLADRTLKNADFALLPELTVQAGYSDRDSFNASSSVALATGQESLQASYSSEKQYGTAGASLVWNMLDFGVSYVRAQQEADRTLIASERRRKVVQNIAQDVSYAFWRTMAAQRLLPKMDQLLEEVEQALADSRSAAVSRANAPLPQLSYQRTLLQTQQKLWGLRESFVTAKAELAVLMNLRPGTDYQVVDPTGALATPALDWFENLDVLEQQALEHRPELREENYLHRISAKEVKKTFLRSLPGIEISLGQQYNNNTYLVENDWQQLGARLSWNLFNLLNAKSASAQAKAAQQVADTRRLSVSMAILAQLHLAHQRYQVAKAHHDIDRQLTDVNDQLHRDTVARVKARQANPLVLIGAEVDLLAAQMNELTSFAELYNAYMRIKNSAGIDVLPDSLASHDLDALSSAIASRL